MPRAVYFPRAVVGSKEIGGYPRQFRYLPRGIYRLYGRIRRIKRNNVCLRFTDKLYLYLNYVPLIVDDWRSGDGALQYSRAVLCNSHKFN